ncbi:MAG: gas vesicle protein GvpO [Bacteroidales bacterium]
MGNINEVRKAAVKSLQESINSQDVTVIKLEQVNDTWNAVAEVYEDDSFLKAMNLPPKKKRVLYSVMLDKNIEVTSFEQLGAS